MLVIDASSGDGLIEVARAIENVAAAPVAVTYAEVGLAADSRLGALAPDAVWLFADQLSDAAYCGLVARELAARFGVAPRVAVFGECAGLRCDLELAALRGRSAFRRRGSDVDAAAARILDFDARA